jgi:D-glycero-alpha-D-manno-heptose-7-phosphate kinase
VSDSFAFRAPTRIDLGGGWTDVPPYDVEQGGFVCTVAISRYATVRVERDVTHGEPEFHVDRDGDLALLRAVNRRYDLRGARVTLKNDFPVAAGLGGSSAAGVACIAAALHLHGKTLGRAELAEASRELEVMELGVAGGRQDHYAAAFGGALGLHFGQNVRVNRIPLSSMVADAIQKHFIVVYTGESRISAKTITAVLGAYRSEASHVRTALEHMKTIAEDTVRFLKAGDLRAVGALVKAQWENQRTLDPAIPTPLIDQMIEVALKKGAYGCKALGASGGGCVLAITADDRADDVRAALKEMGTEIPFSIDTEGVTLCP